MKFNSGDPIAIDFDGTCVTHEYPNIGREIGAENVLHRIVESGGKLILWTMRSDKELREAIQWFEDRGIPLYGVQRNPTQDNWTTSPKAYAKIYIDDAALGCPLISGADGERPYVNWKSVETLLFYNNQMHVYDWLLQPPLNEAEADAKDWLNKFLRLSIYKDTGWLEQHRVSVIWGGKRYICSGASRMGDIWLKSNDSTNYYDHRVNVSELSGWKRVRLS